MFAQIGSFAYRYRWHVIAAWALIVLVSLPILPHVPGQLAVGGFSSDDTEAYRARQVLERQISSYSPSDLVVIFQDDALTAFMPEFVQEAEHTLSGLTDIPEVTGIVPFTANPRQIAADGHTAYSILQINLSPEESQRLMADIRSRIGPSELSVSIAGAPAFYDDIERTTERDLRRAELIAVPFALIALVLVFGSLVAAGVPLLVGGVSVASVLGSIYLIAHVVDLSIFVLNLASLLGLGLAIDFSLFMTSRFREELTHRTVPEAVQRMVETSGRAVFFSGLTTLIGMSGLAMFDVMFLRSVGVAGALVVFFAVAGALTLLPAILGVIGQRINRAAIFKRGIDTGILWHRLSDTVMAHPWATLIPVVLLLVLLGLPFANVRLSSPDATILPLTTESRQGFETLRSEFGDGEISPQIVVIESDGPITSPDTIARIYDISRQIAADPRVWTVDSIVSIDHRISLEQYQLMYADPASITDLFVRNTFNQLAGPNATAMYVYTPYLPASEEAKSVLSAIRSLDPGPGLEMSVDGGTAEIVDVVDVMYRSFPIAISLIVFATYVTLLISFRSVLLPLKAVLMNAMSILASYGALVWIFQEGNLSGLLGFTPLGFVEASLPIVMFCLLFGVSMDYEVFLLNRMREVWDETGDNRLAVASGLASSGRIITGAALILCVVAISFVSADVILVKALGLGIAIAVAIDATIVRALLVPALMRLFGDLNWWAPQALLRRLPLRNMEH